MDKPRKPDWFIVANASRARILTRTDGRPLHLAHVLEHPASRLKSSELGDDRRGSEGRDSHYGGGSAFEQRTDPHRREHERFAHEIAQFIEREARENAFGSIEIFAASPFLGELKKELGKVTAHQLAVAHDLDLSALTLVELERRIPAETGR